MTWQTVPLGEVADLRAGAAFPLAFQGRTAGQYPFAKVGDIGEASRSNGGNLSTARNYVDEADLVALRTRPIPALSTLFAKIGESLRLNARAFNGVPVLIDNNVMAAVPGSDVDPRFLFRFLQQIDLGQIASTTSVPSLRKTDLARWPVRLPPLPEQRRIAAILDEADALQSTAIKLTTASASLAESAFRELELTLVDEHVVPLSEIATVGSGITKGRRPRPTGLVEVPYMTVANVQDKRLDLSNVKTIDASEAEIQRYRLVTNDLLLTEGGDPDKLGRGVVWRSELPVSIHQNHVFRVRAIDTSVDMTWLSWEIGSDYGKRYFLRAAKQTTGIATINSSQLRDFPVRIPSKPAIATFTQRLDEAEALRMTSARRVDAFATLFASLQHRAFRGQL
ncbi:restriction endonuclease subunit S [Microbacterium sp. KSW2-21]|uniref:Restriction endonuclease subunit S n=1 Tax=Microbacterium algihabitans TaxID=3075992 RepID=A0ABU3RTV4_9MICO|nr:restriction endonuclease subunit S [Microbacterium sp. KSW2-21]MDU0326306.1 restriction endonuclease subunit S [Microbacterium sp. KSW2-21]